MVARKKPGRKNCTLSRLINMNEQLIYLTNCCRLFGVFFSLYSHVCVFCHFQILPDIQLSTKKSLGIDQWNGLLTFTLSPNVSCAENTFTGFHEIIDVQKLEFFTILAFSNNFCPLKAALSGNTARQKASGFQTLVKSPIFGILIDVCLLNLQLPHDGVFVFQPLFEISLWSKYILKLRYEKWILKIVSVLMIFQKIFLDLRRICIFFKHRIINWLANVFWVIS